MNEIKVSVIIPTYDRPQFLGNTIRSLKEQDFSGYEIIVVDNACSDNIRGIVKTESRDIDIARYSIKYILEPDIGLHNARHAGAREAKGEMLLYVDDDVVADKNLLGEVFKTYSSPDVGCVGGKILPKWEIEPPKWVNLFPKWYLSILDDEDGPKEVQWIYGCIFSIKKDLLFELGGFNPDAFGDKKKWWYRGDGEIGLLRKVHGAGMKVIYTPKAVVWHFIPKSRLTIDYFKERAFKSGIEASYSKFHYSKGPINSLKLILRSGVFSMYYLAHRTVALLPFRSRIKYKVMASYYKARCLYEVKLVHDSNLIKLTRKHNYLD